MAKPIITLNGLKMVIMLGMLVIILTGIRFAADIIVPFILALFLAVIINPLVQLLVRCRVPRVLAISLLIGLIVMLAIVLLASLGTSLNELARTLPQYRNYLYEPMQTIAPWLQRMGFTVSVVELNKYIDPNAVMTLVTSLLTQLSNAMSSIFLLLLTVVFMLLDVRFAFMWGLLAFALNYIPNIGSVLAAIPPILQVLVFGGLYEALVVLAGYLIVNLVFGNILEPRIMGRGLGLSTLVVFLSLIFWGWLLGPVGMLLSVPLTIIVKIALEQTSGGQSIAFLLSDVSKQ
ncbi:AI-2E family transporter [Klebsiella pneumoniae]|uniref:AI-2E family transporter n=1 Tax=Klebsiella pneumoniae TaxID=573 RepID=UPI002405AFCC|nr:AI-2E family transporter [Klebsiella pneumoniae]MDG0482214.1 AI-2E family transporter [Klebsiella pneumoniae]HBR4372454.1 AI-2E family transporter [Klebsiella pneumoniae]